MAETKGKIISVPNASALLYATGGIGSSLSKLLTCDYGSIELTKEWIIKNCIDYKKFQNFMKSMDNVHFRAFMSNLYSINNFNDKKLENIPKIKLSRFNIDSIFSNIKNPKETGELLDRWEEEGLIYIDMEGKYDLMIPAHLICMNNYLNLESDLKLVILFELIFTAFEGSGSAGQFLEKFIISIYPDTINELPKLQSGNLHVVMGASSEIEGIRITKQNFEKLLNIIFTVSADKGADFFIMTKESEHYCLNLFQIKLGSLEKEITEGTDKSTDSTNHLKPIMKNGLRAYTEFVQHAVNKTGLDISKFQFKSFNLITCKSIEEELRSKHSFIKYDSEEVPIYYIEKSTFFTLLRDKLPSLKNHFQP